MEALILVIDMGVMLYLCWRLFLARDDRDVDLGFLQYGKNDQQRR